ncbi:hypothetical protein F9L69_07025 [Brucella melitensis]|uniref:Uncharacterized protein n=2 Tax=Brucella melitensis TaxID=29459 RepID=C0RG10_BRUMB|nr:Hypothetical protein, conserved [Brucella melitensis ATCC 23457]ADZ67190.1 conserved hypothetical protein [Brucella melitensis M28]AEQ09645.1 hypothetical protein BMNI_I2026 [Brucella melitensis NI]AOG50635.1 hypothetical protein BFL33_09985 [Brucella melitensis]EPZ76049.1 hypothetical protein M798_08190 [Brucella melitensis ADMAS-G1]EXU83256.1 hypothetical protein AX23_06980 [Brucella melitensis 548]RTQ42577.1 hypothetical protein EJW28_02260 [Brucella abortus]
MPSCISYTETGSASGDMLKQAAFAIFRFMQRDPPFRKPAETTSLLPVRRNRPQNWQKPGEYPRA